jgi:TRAP-type uncharacterized transport system substrate-binding protein
MLLFLTYSAVESLPPRSITIEAGVKGGLYDQYSQRLKRDLSQYGIQTKIINRNDSELIASDINNLNNSIIGGFVSQTLTEKSFPHLNQIGTVENAPIYFVTKIDSTIHSLYGLTNQSIAVYPKGSSGYSLCNKVTNIYGVNPAVSFNPVGNENSIIQSVLRGHDELGCFVTNSLDPTITHYIAVGKLKVVSLSNTLGAAINSGYFQQNILQSGSLSINPPVPTTPVNLLSVPIEFMVKADLNRSLITAISLSLKSEFSTSSPFATANTFPTSKILDFPSDSRSELILNDGEPWEYHHYSFRIAAFIDEWLTTYGALFGTLFVLITVLDHLGFRKFIVKMQNSRVRTANRFLDKLLLKSSREGLTHKEKIHLERLEKWIEKQALDARFLKNKIEKFKKD